MNPGPIADDRIVPRINPVPEGVARPFWSVMIPSYNADDYLEQVLQSVLDQAPGPDQMQITVVDDASPGADRAKEIVDRLSKGRVEFHLAESNLGLAGNWNRCLELARGHWVHLLHQDDLIEPGFYEKLRQAVDKAPGLGSAFCRHRIIDPSGKELRVSERERETAGLVDDMLARLATGQRIQCPSIVVSRGVYERLGGFRTDLRYALDWEMWARIAASAPVWYEPEVLASYREHLGNETSRLVREGEDMADLERGLELILQLVPEPDRSPLRHQAGKFLGMMAMLGTQELMNDGEWRAGLARLRVAAAHDPKFANRKVDWAYRKWVAKIRLNQLIRPSGRPRAHRGQARS